MQRPSILNDFSFYRRNFAKMVELDIQFPVLEQEANVISMFLAQPCPLTMGIAKKVKDSRDDEASLVFANIANALCRATREEFRHPETVDFVCSAMTCACVIYDHSSNVGIFGNKAVKLKPIVDTLGGYVAAPATKFFVCMPARCCDATLDLWLADRRFSCGTSSCTWVSCRPGFLVVLALVGSEKKERCCSTS